MSALRAVLTRSQLARWDESLDGLEVQVRRELADGCCRELAFAAREKVHTTGASALPHAVLLNLSDGRQLLLASSDPVTRHALLDRVRRGPLRLAGAEQRHGMLEVAFTDLDRDRHVVAAHTATVLGGPFVLPA